MKISSYSMELNSSSSQQTTETEQVNLTSWVDSQGSSNQNKTTGSIVLDLSDEGKKLSFQALNTEDLKK